MSENIAFSDVSSSFGDLSANSVLVDPGGGWGNRESTLGTDGSAEDCALDA
jgi:hypothetical protein